MIRNKNQFLVNSEIHHIDTRQKANFHQPSVNVATYLKGVYYLGVKVFNVLPSYIKTEFENLRNLKRFYKNSYTKIYFIPWMNTSNFKRLKIAYYLNGEMENLTCMH